MVLIIYSPAGQEINSVSHQPVREPVVVPRSWHVAYMPLLTTEHISLYFASLGRPGRKQFQRLNEVSYLVIHGYSDEIFNCVLHEAMPGPESRYMRYIST